MIYHRINNLTSKIAIICLFSILGCSAADPIPKKEERKHFFFPTRQLPPQPVYGRLRSVYSPEPIVSNLNEESLDTPRLSKIYEIKVKKTSLEEVAKLFGKASNYHSYCSSLIATNIVSLHKIGTLDELAQSLADSAGILISIDHDNRSIQFLSGSLVGPEIEPALP